MIVHHLNRESEQTPPAGGGSFCVRVEPRAGLGVPTHRRVRATREAMDPLVMAVGAKVRDGKVPAGMTGSIKYDFLAGVCCAR